MAESLWVVENYQGCNPKLMIWELIEETEASYIVRVREKKNRVFRKWAAGRRYFRDEERAVRCLRVLYTAWRQSAVRQTQRLAVLLDKDDSTILRYAQGDESVVDDVEREIDPSEVLERKGVKEE